MKQRRALSRRAFLKRGARAATAAIAAPLVLPACSSGANEKVRLGFIGLGWRFNLYMDRNLVPKEGFAITAICDVDNTRMESARAHFAKDVATFKDYREMLASDTVDAVVIATPDHWHARQTIDACRAGKDVYVEKPLSLTIAEGSAVVKAARETGRIVQVGTQQRSAPLCMQGCQAVLEGAIGKVTEIHAANCPSSRDCDITDEESVPSGLDWDLWLGQTPHRPFNKAIFENWGLPLGPDGRLRGWSAYTPWCGGFMTACGVHGLDMVQWALARESSGPVEAWPELGDDGHPVAGSPNPFWNPGGKLGPEQTCPVHLKYADGVTIHLDDKGPGFGALFVGEGGALMVDRFIYQVRRSGEEMKTVREPDESTDGGTTAHMENWLDCIKSRRLPRAGVEVAHRSTTMCHLGNIARWTGRKIVWDPKTESFGNDEEANSYMRRTARPPWGFA